MNLKDFLKTLAGDQATLGTDTQAQADARAALAAAQAASAKADQVVADDQSKIAADQKAVGAAIGRASTTGFIVDLTPDADGNVTLYVEDNSEKLYHTVQIPTTASVIPDPQSPPQAS